MPAVNAQSLRESRENENEKKGLVRDESEMNFMKIRKQAIN